MWVLQKIIFISLITLFVFADQGQHKYVVFQENLTVEGLNSKYADIAGGVFKINETVNALNLSFKMKTELTEDSKILVTAMRWVNDGYRFRVVSINKSIKEATEMEMFDLQNLYLKRSRPSIVWPIQKGVIYRASGWVPDSSKFPPNIPGGRMKVSIIFSLKDKINFCTVTWFLKLIYKK